MNSRKAFTYSLDSRWRVNTFLIAITLPGLLLIAQVVRIAVAHQWGESTNLAEIRKAAKLDPANSSYQYRMGLLYEYDWEHMNLEDAVRYLHAAALLQPNRADYWSSLGHACFTVGDASCADKAYENSIRLAPGIPLYQWEIADYLLIAGRQTESLVHFRRFLELKPDDPTLTFTICLRVFDDPDLIWKALLEGGADANLKLAYINFLNDHGRSAVAYQFWNRITDSRMKMSFSAVQPYLERLIATNQIEQASKVWQDIESLGVIEKSGTDYPANRIFNGGFEQEPLNSGFDWRYQTQQYLTLDFANDCYHSKRCLQLDFTVPNNADYQPVYQIVPVQPNQQYELSADVRSADISSDSGPRLRVVDPKCPACLSGESQASVGTTPWHEISLNFVAGPKTDVVHVSLWRPRGRSFPMEIQGRFWLADVSLKAAPANQVAPQSQVQ